MNVAFDSAIHRPAIVRRDDVLVGRFQAMGSPCEILIATTDLSAARALFDIALIEAHRLESKYSRYRGESVLSRINAAAGTEIVVDEETAGVLDFAHQCHDLSDGLFDVTTGVLRRAWTFDGGTSVPKPETIAALMPRVGWGKVVWRRPTLLLPSGMEIDFGGICKEYAADRIAALLSDRSDAAVLVNLGGDIVVRGKRVWHIGIEDPVRPGRTGRYVDIRHGGLATSGSYRRYTTVNGARACHILHPLIGWPVSNPPNSVTVAAPTCTAAGFLSTLAMLQGAGAESFLAGHAVSSWCVRDAA